MMAQAEPKQAEMTARLIELIEPVLRAEGKELVELEFRRESQGWVLRLFIEQEDGITVDDCAQVSHVVGDLLDVAARVEVAAPPDGSRKPLVDPA